MTTTPQQPDGWPADDFISTDRPVVIAVGNDGQFAASCEAIGLPELVTDPRFATNPLRVIHVETIAELIGDRIRHRTADELICDRCGRVVVQAPLRRTDGSSPYAGVNHRCSDSPCLAVPRCPKSRPTATDYRRVAIWDSVSRSDGRTICNQDGIARRGGGTTWMA